MKDFEETKETYYVCTVLIDTVAKIRDFLSIMNAQKDDYALIRGIYIVNAKSNLGIFSLDLSRPLSLHSTINENEDLIHQLKEKNLVVEE